MTTVCLPYQSATQLCASILTSGFPMQVNIDYRIACTCGGPPAAFIALRLKLFKIMPWLPFFGSFILHLYGSNFPDLNKPFSPIATFL